MCEGDQGHIILALSRLDDIIEIDSDRLYARIQPAVSETRLQEAATAAGMTVPRVPHSGLRFTRANLLAIEVVTARGRIIRANRRALIEQADSVDLLAKLAGTMCVVTEVTLPMIPRLDADRSGCS